MMAMLTKSFFAPPQSHYDSAMKTPAPYPRVRVAPSETARVFMHSLPSWRIRLAPCHTAPSQALPGLCWGPPSSATACAHSKTCSKHLPRQSSSSLPRRGPHPTLVSDMWTESRASACTPHDDGSETSRVCEGTSSHGLELSTQHLLDHAWSNAVCPTRGVFQWSPGHACRL